MSAASLIGFIKPVKDYVSVFSRDHVSKFFSLKWWTDYVVQTYNEDPEHLFIEVLCLVIIVYLLTRPSYDPSQTDRLSPEEEDKLIAEWRPLPVVMPADISNEGPYGDPGEHLVVESSVGTKVVANGRELENFCTNNFLGLAQHPEVLKVAAAAVDKYGVGACGPRGFYGTIDVHLEFEAAIAEFYGTAEAILYSDSIALMASVIPAFSKVGDLLIVDEACHFGIQQGVTLSKSNVLYFKHNDMDDLERVLQEVREKDALHTSKKLNRRFIVVEGVSREHGDIVPLDRLVDLKNDYKYRVMLDDTLAVGVLGATGHGTPEHCNVHHSEIDFICAANDATLAAVGGYCTGRHEVANHQRLSGLGYCFSASSPPYTAVAATAALQILRREPKRCAAVRARAALLRKLLRGIPQLRFPPGSDESPVVVVRLARTMGSPQVDEAFFRVIREKMLQAGYVLEVPRHIQADRIKVEPGLRITVSSEHTEASIQAMVKKLVAALEETAKL